MPHLVLDAPISQRCRMSSIRACLLGLLLVIASAPQAYPAEPVTLPGAVWALVPPPDFEVKTSPFTFFQHPSGAGIMVQDTPRAPILRSQMEWTGNVAEEGRLDELEEVIVDGKKGFLIVVYMPSHQGTTVSLVLEGEHSNAQIVVAIPDSAKSLFPIGALKQALLTTVERPAGADDRLASLPFAIGDRAGMRVAHIVAGSMLVLTDGPSDDYFTAADQPFAILMTSPVPVGVTVDARAELDALIARLRQEYPSATDFSARVFEEGGDEIAEITFAHIVGTQAVAGVSWSKAVGERLMMMIGQYPVDDEAAMARLRGIFDSAAVK